MKKSDTKTVKNNNIALIFDCLLGGQVSRAEIVKATGLSKATVTAITNELIAENRLVEIGKENLDTVGRPAINLDINWEFRYAAGFSLHRNTLSVCITDLKMEIVDFISVNTRDFSDPKSATDFLFKNFLKLLEKNSIPIEKIIGIGISSPGPLNYKSGLIHKPGELELFFDFNIVEYLKSKTHLPIFLDNNSVLLSLLDQRLRKEKLKDYIFIVISDGVGSVIVSKGQIFRGGLGYSGELGHTSVDAQGPLCNCGNRGCLEKYVTLKSLKSKFGFSDYKTVVENAIKGEEKSQEILNFIAEKLSFALINYINLTDPAEIVIYGELNYNYETLFQKLSYNINSRSAVGKLHKIKILPSLLKNDANISATTSALIKAYFEQRL